MYRKSTLSSNISGGMVPFVKEFANMHGIVCVFILLLDLRLTNHPKNNE